MDLEVSAPKAAVQGGCKYLHWRLPWALVEQDYCGLFA